MPRIRGKDARRKGSGTQLEQSDGAKVSSRAPAKQLSRQEKRRRVAQELAEDARRNRVDINARVQSVGKRPKGHA
jgi:hypothetical protein